MLIQLVCHFCSTLVEALRKIWRNPGCPFLSQYGTATHERNCWISWITPSMVSGKASRTSMFRRAVRGHQGVFMLPMLTNASDQLKAPCHVHRGDTQRTDL